MLIGFWRVLCLIKVAELRFWRATMNTLRLMKQFAMPNRLGVAFAGSL
jgi:hypothetical protein